MIYKNIIAGRYVSRPNRFIAIVEIDGVATVCHVKNTGRCKELLVPGAKVFLEKSDNSTRKTLYDLVAVEKNGKLINMDSYAPNIAVSEFLPYIFSDYEIIKSECKYKNSRFDFYIKEKNGRESFLEVKGVTLENDGVCMFPDAPTKRGVKHIKELIDAYNSGYGAYIFFVLQLEDVKYFTPNKETHPEFADVLKEAENSGVKILVYNCDVSGNSMTIKDKINYLL